MTKWLFVRFLKASGRIGGGSVIFALILFGIALWEHHFGRNVPTLLLVAVGVGFFCYGCYLAWLKEMQDKEKVIASIESPDFDLLLSGWTFFYDELKDITVFFLAASVLNKGHDSSVIRWDIEYLVGLDKELPEMPSLVDSYTIPFAKHSISFTNDDLITVKSRESSIRKGQLLDGRILFTLPRDRREQVKHSVPKINVPCCDFLGKKATAIFIPSTIPFPSILKNPRERIVANEHE